MDGEQEQEKEKEEEEEEEDRKPHISLNGGGRPRRDKNDSL